MPLFTLAGSGGIRILSVRPSSLLIVDYVPGLGTIMQFALHQISFLQQQKNDL